MSSEAEQPDRGLKVAAGAALNLVGIGFVRILGIVNLAVLGRLLTPEQFGVMALALLVVGIIEATQNRQFEMALIRRTSREPSHFDTAFTMGICLGLIGAVAMQIAAAPVARLFETPQLEAMIRWLAIVPILVGTANPYFTNFEIDLDFRPHMMRMVSSRIAYSVVAIAAAFALRSEWALLLGFIGMATWYWSFTWRKSREMPRFRAPHWREFLRFGGWLSLSGLTEFAAKRMPVAVLGRVAGMGPTGIFQVGNEIGTTMTAQFYQPVGHAIFPGLTGIADQKARFEQAYLLAISSLMCFALPLGFGMSLTAPEIVRIILGSQWDAAVPVVQWLAPIAAIGALREAMRYAVMIRDTTRDLFFLMLGRLILIVPMSIVGWQMAGLQGVIIAQAVALSGEILIALYIAHLRIGLPLFAPVTRSWRSIVSVLVMTAAVLLLGQYLPHGSDRDVSGAIVNLLLKASLGATVYVAGHFLLWVASGRGDGPERRLAAVIRDKLGAAGQRA